MTFDASNRKDVRRLEKDAARAERQRREVLRGLMSTTTGRAYIWSELGAAHIFATSFSLEPIQMAFAEGERNMGLRLLNDVIESCPDEFILMVREQNARDSASQQPRGQDGNGGVEESGVDDSGDDGGEANRDYADGRYSE